MSESLNTTLKPSLSFIDMEFAEFNESAIEYASLDFMVLPNDSLLSDHQPGLIHMPYADNLPSFSPAEFPTLVTEPDIKRKSEEAEASSAYSSLREDMSSKRRKKSLKDREKPKEMVHVRARRGQATDSHSLAERVRRERINEKMRCLQDLVPGCYKTMGMATMLDEIINYVQSLQNQVEFLSMKLSAASSLYDFRLGLQAMEALQQAGNDQDVDTSARDHGHGGYTGFMSTMPF